MCFSEASKAFFIIEDDGLIVYNVDVDAKGKILFRLTLAKKGFPKSIELQRGGNTYDKCSILGLNEMGFLGVEPSDRARRTRLFKVDVTGKLVWGNIPPNEVPAGKTVTSLISVFPNGTSIFGGNGYYVIVDKDGRGVLKNKVDNGNFGTFAIGAQDGDAVSYSGDHFGPQESVVLKGLHPEPIIFEEARKIVAFKKTGTGGKIYDMDGRRNIPIPTDWEFYDYDGRTFFTDALMTLSFEKQYPFNKFIELSAIAIQKEDFGPERG